MAQSKAHEVERYLAKPDPKHRVFLIYGPDRGLVSERATTLARSCGADLDDPFSTIRLDADDAAADPGRLASEAHTVSMFGGDRLVWVKGSTQKNLVKAVEPVLDLPPDNAIVVIEAGDLKKSAPLRTRIEKCAAAMALPCYQDQAQALDGIIDFETAQMGQSIDKDARLAVKQLIGGDRLASRAEVQKLCLYAGQGATIDLDMVETIVGDASALAIDTVLDSAATGDIATMEHTYKRLLAQGTSVTQIVLAAQRHFQTLHATRCMMDKTGQSPTSAVNTLRPPVNFKRKDAIARALNIWPSQALARALERLQKVSFESRANAALAEAIAATGLLAITIEAGRRR